MNTKGVLKYEQSSEILGNTWSVDGRVLVRVVGEIEHEKFNKIINDWVDMFPMQLRHDFAYTTRIIG